MRPGEHAPGLRGRGRAGQPQAPLLTRARRTPATEGGDDRRARSSRVAPATGPPARSWLRGGRRRSAPEGPRTPWRCLDSHWPGTGPSTNTNSGTSPTSGNGAPGAPICSPSALFIEIKKQGCDPAEEGVPVGAPQPGYTHIFSKVCQGLLSQGAPLWPPHPVHSEAERRGSLGGQPSHGVGPACRAPALPSCGASGGQHSPSPMKPQLRQGQRPCSLGAARGTPTTHLGQSMGTHTNHQALLLKSHGKQGE